MKVLKFIFVAVILLGINNSCKKFKNYDTIIRVISDGSDDRIFVGLEGEDSFDFYTMEDLGYIDAAAGDTMEFFINWSEDYYQEIKRRTKKKIIYRITSFSSTPYPAEAATEEFKLKPSRIYLWDAKGREVIDTGEKTEKKPNGGSKVSSCSDLAGNYTVVSINGSSLPYSEPGNSAQVTSGSISFTSDGKWSSTLNFNNNGDKTTTNRSGTYDCSGSSGTLSNTSGVAGTFSISDGSISVVTGSTTVTYE